MYKKYSFGLAMLITGYAFLMANPFVHIKKHINEKNEQKSDEEIAQMLHTALQLSVQVIAQLSAEIHETANQQKGIGVVVNKYMQEGTFGTVVQRKELCVSIQKIIDTCKQKLAIQ